MTSGFQLCTQSSGRGGGASFRVDLPVVSPPEAEAPETRIDLRPLDLLLVEDNQDVAETLDELLSASGHRISVVGSAEEALTSLRSHRPDVVLCDIGLPGMDGYELAKRLRADPDLGGLRLVAMTGFGDASSRARMEEAGFDRHLIKPVQIDALYHCLSRVAASAQPTQSGG